ncbi:uncharacterized protein [Patagioenas fasciata]|uniref:uncharacterized protein n=1 Tax=Patagioenas fasciata TaxID=372321 RepID=UPI003A9A1810
MPTVAVAHPPRSVPVGSGSLTASPECVREPRGDPTVKFSVCRSIWETSDPFLDLALEISASDQVKKAVTNRPVSSPVTGQVSPEGCSGPEHHVTTTSQEAGVLCQKLQRSILWKASRSDHCTPPHSQFAKHTFPVDSTQPNSWAFWQVELLDVFPHGAALVIFIIFIIFVIFVIFIIFIIFVIFTIRFRGFWRSEQREMGWGGSSTGPGSSCPASQAHPQLLQLHPKEVASSKNSVAPPRASNGKRPQAEKSWAQKKAPRSEDLQKIPGLLQEIPIINKVRSAVLFSKARRSSRALSIGARVRL